MKWVRCSEKFRKKDWTAAHKGPNSKQKAVRGAGSHVLGSRLSDVGEKGNFSKAARVCKKIEKKNGGNWRDEREKWGGGGR